MPFSSPNEEGNLRQEFDFGKARDFISVRACHCDSISVSRLHGSRKLVKDQALLVKFTLEWSASPHLGFSAFRTLILSGS